MRRTLLLVVVLAAACSRNVIPDDEGKAPAPRALPTPAMPAGTMASPPPGTPPPPAAPPDNEFALVPAHRPTMLDAAPAPAPAPVGGAAAFVSGTVEISPELAAKVAATDVVWIVARPAEGGRPVAIVKGDAKLPQPFRLTTADNPMGSGPFPAKMLLKARVDKDGDAMSTSKGDLEGLAENVAPGASDVRIVIDREIDYE